MNKFIFSFLLVCGLAIFQIHSVFGLDDQIRIKIDEIGSANEIKIISGAKNSIAVFLKGNKLWFVFDSHIKLNMIDNAERETGILRGFHQLSQIKDGSVAYIEIMNPDDFEITAQRKEDDLIVKITPYDNSILTAEIAAKRDIIKRLKQSGNKVDIAVHTKTKKVISFVDPFVGEKIVVVPETECVRNNDNFFVDFDVLQSVIGVVIKPKNDYLIWDLRNGWLGISSKEYLNISEDNIVDNAKSHLSFERFFKSDSDIVLDLRAYRVSVSDFNKQLLTINSIVTNAYDYTSKGDSYLNLAMFFLANQWYVEAKGILELVKRYSDVIERDYQARMIIGVIYLLCGDINEAYDIINSIDLNSVNLKQRSEVRFWMNLSELAFKVHNKDIKDFEYIDTMMRSVSKKIINNRKGFISKYNSDILNDISFKMMEYALSLEKHELIDAIIKSMSAKKLEGMNLRLMNYYSGKLLAIDNNLQEAIVKFESCASDPTDRYTYSHCNFELTNLMRKTSRINQIQYINALQGISTTWRGDNFEGDVLGDLAETYYEMQDIPNAIRVWKIISNAYPEAYNGFIATTKASKSFINYFKTSNDSKLAKLAFFYEFKDLIPLGDEGDEIILQTASYMVELDLLDQAVKVMEYQVKNRLFGIVREKVVNQLINIYCSMKNWSAAENLVDEVTEFPFNMTNPILSERKYLYVNAIVDGGQYFDAVALLYGDSSHKADELRSKAFFELKEWDNFNDNSEPYLYSIRYDKNFSLSDEDIKKILKQNISYFNGKQKKLFNNLFLDFKPRLKKGEKNSERNKLFYQIANDLEAGDFKSNKQKQDNVKNLIKQLVETA